MVDAAETTDRRGAAARHRRSRPRRLGLATVSVKLILHVCVEIGACPVDNWSLFATHRTDTRTRPTVEKKRYLIGCTTRSDNQSGTVFYYGFSH